MFISQSLLSAVLGGMTFAFRAASFTVCIDRGLPCVLVSQVLVSAVLGCITLALRTAGCMVCADACMDDGTSLDSTDSKSFWSESESWLKGREVQLDGDPCIFVSGF